MTVTDDSRRYLDFLRQELQRSEVHSPTGLPRKATADNLDYRLRFLKEAEGLGYPAHVLEQARSALKERTSTTSGINRHWEQILRHHEAELLEATQRGESLPSSNILCFGTLPTGDVNAMALRTPSGGYLIVLNEGLFPFLYLFAKAVVGFVPQKRASLFGGRRFDFCDHALQRAMQTNTEYYLRLLEATYCYVVLGHASLATPYTVNYPHMEFAERLAYIAESFVLAHEYAHIARNHVGRASSVSRQLLGSHEAEVLSRDWDQELEADELGAELTVQTRMRAKSDLALSYVGIEFFFACLAVVYDALGIEDGTKTHPPVIRRLERLREWLRASFPKRQVLGALDLSGTIGRITLSLWTKVKPHYMKMLDEARRIAGQPVGLERA